MGIDSDRIKALRIKPEAKRRSQTSVGMIYLFILALTGASVYFAWWRPEDNRRVVPTVSGRSLLAQQKQDVASDPPGSSHPSPNQDEVVLTVTGYIVTRERIELSPRFLGVITSIGVRKGDTVTNGQVVARLDDAEQSARLIEAQGRLASARVAVQKAELDYERVKQLRVSQIETKQNEDDLRLALEAARADLIQAEGQADLARTYLDWTVLRSPINGVVLEKLADAGELVMPQSFGGTRGPSTAVIAVADLQDLQVEIDMSESDLAKVNVGQPCRVAPEAYPNRRYDGYVAEIAPEANRQKGTLQLKVQIQSPDRFLTPELNARVDFLSTAGSRPRPQP